MALPILTNKQRYKKYGRNWNEVWSHSVAITMFGHNVRVHKLVVPRVYAWEKRVREYEVAHGLPHWTPKTIQCGNWRSIIGSSSRSLHSWMIAWDIDPAKNPLGSKKTNIKPYVITFARQAGLTWGGTWRRKDPMHFEFRR
jgi:hypothetical protein